VITVKRVTDLHPLLAQMSYLRQCHWEEAGHKGPLLYRYDILERMWDQGMIRVWGVFDGDFLVGHLTAYVVIQLASGNLAAEDESIYVLPEYRSGYGAALMRMAMADLRAEGVIDIGATCAVENKTPLLLRRLGFKHTANRYVIRVNEPGEQHVTDTARAG
jgi:ribosomal protein S18 acetylase RimI-like enzyme